MDRVLVVALVALLACQGACAQGNSSAWYNNTTFLEHVPSSYGNFSISTDAFNRTHILPIINVNAAYFNGTLFLPTNQAWLDLATEANVTLSKILSSDVLVAVTAYHIVLDVKLNITGLPNATNLTTANSLNVTVSKSQAGNISIIDEGGRSAHVLAGDIDSNNLVINVVDKVLIPTFFIEIIRFNFPINMPPFNFDIFGHSPRPVSTPSRSPGRSPGAQNPSTVPSPVPSPTPSPSGAGSLMASVTSALQVMNLASFAFLLENSGVTITGDATIFPPTDAALDAALAMYSAFMPGLDPTQLTSTNVPDVLKSFLPILVNPLVAPGRAYTRDQLTNGLVMGRLTVRKTSTSTSVRLTSTPSQSARLTAVSGVATYGAFTVHIHPIDSLLLDITAIAGGKK